VFQGPRSEKLSRRLDARSSGNTILGDPMTLSVLAAPEQCQLCQKTEQGYEGRLGGGETFRLL
jgi:hypothetical protein